MAWERTPQAERKKDLLMIRLIREDKRLCKTKENMLSLALQIQRLKLQRSDKQSGKLTKLDNNKRIENLKKRTTCAICKEKGHWARVFE